MPVLRGGVGEPTRKPGEPRMAGESDGRAVAGVEVVEPRVSAELPVVAHGERATLRLLSLPGEGVQPRLDRLLVVSGQLPRADDEIAVEKHFAVHQGLKEGDRLPLASG